MIIVLHTWSGRGQSFQGSKLCILNVSSGTSGNGD